MPSSDPIADRPAALWIAQVVHNRTPKAERPWRAAKRRGREVLWTTWAPPETISTLPSIWSRYTHALHRSQISMTLNPAHRHSDLASSQPMPSRPSSRHSEPPSVVASIQPSANLPVHRLRSPPPAAQSHVLVVGSCRIAQQRKTGSRRRPGQPWRLRSSRRQTGEDEAEVHQTHRCSSTCAK
jgi:hypothetical protein